jgi:hypothetical protein
MELPQGQGRRRLAQAKMEVVMRMRLLALAISGLAVLATTALTGFASDASAQTRPTSEGPGGCERDKPTPTTS